MGLVSVYQAADEFMALTVRDLLLENRILCVIRPDVISGFNFDMGSSGGSWGEVLVEEATASRACELIGAFRGTLGELQEAEPEDSTDSTD